MCWAFGGWVGGWEEGTYRAVPSTEQEASLREEEPPPPPPPPFSPCPCGIQAKPDTLSVCPRQVASSSRFPPFKSHTFRVFIQEPVAIYSPQGETWTAARGRSSPSWD